MPLEIIPIILGLWAFWVAFIISDTQDNFLRERLKKTSGSARKERLFAKEPYRSIVDSLFIFSRPAACSGNTRALLQDNAEIKMASPSG